MWNQALVRELAIILVIKFLALYVIWLAFFSESTVRELTPHEVGQFLLGESSNAIPRQHRVKQSTGAKNDY